MSKHTFWTTLESEAAPDAERDVWDTVQDFNAHDVAELLEIAADDDASATFSAKDLRALVKAAAVLARVVAISQGAKDCVLLHRALADEAEDEGREAKQ